MASRISCAVLILTSCCVAADLQRFEAVEPHMGTLVRITLYAPDITAAKRGFEAAFRRIHQLDEILSDYKPESELSRLRAGPPVAVSTDLFRVLSTAQELAAETGGAFDVTLGPVIRLWREARRNQRLPSEAERSKALERCGYTAMKLGNGTVQLLKEGMQLDVGGIAKGYAADEALAELRSLGLTHALVAMSGDLAIGSPPPRKRGWNVQAQNRTMLLHDCAVSTSGDRQQFVEIGGRRYSHIVDPRTGLGLTTRLEVTVIARHGIAADALATAISVLGSKRGLKLAKHHAAKALIVKPPSSPERPATSR